MCQIKAPQISLMFTDFSVSKKGSWLMARCSQPFSDFEVLKLCFNNEYIFYISGILL